MNNKPTINCPKEIQRLQYESNFNPYGSKKQQSAEKELIEVKKKCGYPKYE